MKDSVNAPGARLLERLAKLACYAKTGPPPKRRAWYSANKAASATGGSNLHAKPPEIGANGVDIKRGVIP